jgi:hypothetical protein
MSTKETQSRLDEIYFNNLEMSKLSRDADEH